MSFSFGIQLKDVRDPVAHAKSTIGTKEKPKLIFTIRSFRHLLNKQKELDSFGVG
jgi:hypothetical protein